MPTAGRNFFGGVSVDFGVDCFTVALHRRVLLYISHTLRDEGDAVTLALSSERNTRKRIPGDGQGERTNIKHVDQIHLEAYGPIGTAICQFRLHPLRHPDRRHCNLQGDMGSSSCRRGGCPGRIPILAESYIITQLNTTGNRPQTNDQVLAETKKELDPTTFKDFPITEKTVTSHNTAIYRFGLPSANSILGLPIGQHISLAATLDVADPKTGKTERKEVVRSYTPISSDVNPGYFDLMIKSYPTGNISRHLATLKVGDTMKVRGPKGAMVYTPNMVRRFGMIAGGTGITPMLQIIQAIRRGRKSGDKTVVDLIFANVDDKDILLREDIDKIAAEDEKFNVYYVLNNPPEKWSGGVGFVTADMIKVGSFHFISTFLRLHAALLRCSGMGLTSSLGAPSPSSEGHQDPDLRPAPHGQRDEEGHRVTRLR